MNRRQFLLASTAALAATTLRAAAPARGKKLGLSIASYTRWNGKFSSERFPGWKTALEVLDHCAELGAGCLQIGVNGWTADFAGQVRTRREKLALALEGQIGLPKAEGDVAKFEASARAAKEAGATILRTVCLGGRRYEAFDSMDAWHRFREQSWKSLTLAEPVVKALGMKLAIENHKDWRTDEQLDLLRRLDSEAVGVNFDFGNNLALLEDPRAVCEGVARFIMTTHIKDMGVQEYPGGFLLSEVPMGEGLLDLPRLIAICEQANPAVQFNLEMMTRDPLQVPVFEQKYWTTMPDVPAPELARTLRTVKANPPKRPLPRTAGLSTDERLAFEEENVRKSFAHARSTLGFA